MKKIATFEDGYTDRYNGTRDVTAAWRIVDTDTGETVRSGHSLDPRTAEKTASSNLSDASLSRKPFYKLGAFHDFVRCYVLSSHARPHAIKKFREAGEWPEDIKTVGDMRKGARHLYSVAKKLNEQARAEAGRRYRIEVIDI